MVDVAALRRFENLIRARCGIQMRAPEAAALSQTLEKRTQARRCGSPLHYLDFLDAATAAAREEWKLLFQLLTNQESYFFRDAEQLALIRDRLLPELIRRNHASRTLRIWSAGCSTGEEPYSLAMMLEDVLPFREGWRVLILGTDISEAALDRARRGVYGNWSFRALKSEMRERFFVPCGKEWQVNGRLRASVTWQAGNLFKDEFPFSTGANAPGANAIHDMDLILCRNVFIYFGREEVAQVLRKFRATLRPEGFLVVGHAELHGAELGDLQARSFPQSVIYQRGEAAPRPTRQANQDLENRAKAPVAPSPPGVLPVQKPLFPAAQNAFPQAENKPLTDGIAQANDLIRQGKHQAALEILPKEEPKTLAVLCALAQAHANLGHLDAAETNCQAAIALSAFVALPYQILARIAAERGLEEAAKGWLKKVIYLNPASVRGYLELSAFYAREGDTVRAAQMTRAALDVLGDQSDETLVPGEEYAVEEHLTVGEIKRQLRANRAV